MFLVLVQYFCVGFDVTFNSRVCLGRVILVLVSLSGSTSAAPCPQAWGMRQHGDCLRECVDCLELATGWQVAHLGNCGVHKRCRLCCHWLSSPPAAASSVSVHRPVSNLTSTDNILTLLDTGLHSLQWQLCCDLIVIRKSNLWYYELRIQINQSYS